MSSSRRQVTNKEPLHCFELFTALRHNLHCSTICTAVPSTAAFLLHTIPLLWSAWTIRHIIVFNWTLLYRRWTYCQTFKCKSMKGNGKHNTKVALLQANSCGLITFISPRALDRANMLLIFHFQKCCWFFKLRKFAIFLVFDWKLPPPLPPPHFQKFAERQNSATKILALKLTPIPPPPSNSSNIACTASPNAVGYFFGHRLHLHHLYLTFSVVALGPVVTGATLAEHKVVRTEYAPKRSGPRFKSQTDPRSH